MDALELRQLLARPEWTQVEIKKSATAFPQDAASTICAFANTGGGYLILGVDEKQLPQISGIQPDKFDTVQNECLGLLKDKQKFSSLIEYDPPSVVEVDKALVLVIQIQESKRQNKPVKLIKNKQGKVYIRKGARDEEASDEEITRMQVDANSAGVTGQLLELDVETCFDANTLKWYRKVYESRHNGKHYELSNVEFLDELGLIREEADDLNPTKAAVLMFGTEKEMSHLLARKVVDALWYYHNMDEHTEKARWQDRRPLEDSTPNLFDAWRILSERFMYFSEQSFEIDESNLQRNNEPPDYIGFREATVNLLIHQDFSDHYRVPKIEFFKDTSVYWNPGDSMVDDNLLAKGKSASRNPLVMQTFHRIGLSDRAGSGLRDIMRNWQQLDRPEPEIKNDKAHKTFQITLGKRQQVSELQETFQQKIGAKLSPVQARVFAACLLQPVDVEGLAATLEVSSAEIYPALDYLNRQGLVIANPAGYQAQEHFREPLAEWAIQGKATKSPQKSDQASEKVTKLKPEELDKSDQAERVLGKLNKKQSRIIAGLEGEMTRLALMEIVGQSHRTNFKNKQLKPVIDLGLVLEKYPETPNHPEQAYYLTDLGKAVKDLLLVKSD